MNDCNRDVHEPCSRSFQAARLGTFQEPPSFGIRGSVRQLLCAYGDRRFEPLRDLTYYYSEWENLAQ
jgi:hypothetical protein